MRRQDELAPTQSEEDALDELREEVKTPEDAQYIAEVEGDLDRIGRTLGQAARKALARTLPTDLEIDPETGMLASQKELDAKD